MKKTAFTLLVILLSFTTGFTQTPGINFRPITFDEAIQAAKKEKKPIFLHAFATWCHFCEYMKDSVYPNQKVGDFYNNNFVCIKMDMEKEGANLNKKLRVQNYPALVFFDYNNAVMMHRVAGQRTIEEFLEIGKDALDTTRQLRYFEQKYYSKKATPKEVYTYIKMLEKAGLDNQLVINSYLSEVPDKELLTQDNWRIMYDLFRDVEMVITQKIIYNREAYAKKYTADSIDNKLISLYTGTLMQKVQKLDTLGYKNIIEKLRKTNLDITDKIIAFAELNKSKVRSDWKRYQIEAVPFVEKYCKDDYRRLNEIAYNFYERVYDPAMLAKALEWSKMAVSMQNTIRNNYTLACLHYKIGNKQEALAAIQLTIDMAKKNGTDYKQPLLLLEKIQDMPDIK
ncbi:MAG: DUF255 domain-containing protein [Bacteroidia bacterium]